MTITETDNCTYIEDGDRTFAIPKKGPLQCSNCKVMSGVFVNWHADSVCVPCHDEAERAFMRQERRRAA